MDMSTYLREVRKASEHLFSMLRVDAEVLERLTKEHDRAYSLFEHFRVCVFVFRRSTQTGSSAELEEPLSRVAVLPWR